ncbi:MAG: hypothetical protein MI748_17800 [Opitutales bacterium]|nr:hypothetical protein [Opitutales bacterium]
MELTESQKNAVTHWIEEGQTLSQVQSQLNEEFGISMTFMEVRFLVDDLNLELKKSAPEPVENQATDTVEEVSPELEDTGVSIEVDKIVTPGAIVSGSVNFSDGINAQWQIDQMGRLGLSGVDKDYQPSPEDLQEFQMKLQEELRKKGMA